MDQVSNTQPKFEDRFKIAIRVLKWSSVGICLLAVVTILGAAIVAYNNSKPDFFVETSKYVFASLVPLLGTWVGTIIAFYFSSENYETASESVRKTLRDVQKERLETYLTGQTMRPYDQINKVVLDDTNQATMLDIVLEDHFARKLSRKITRIPVFLSNRIVKYMIHGSVLYEFFSEIQSDLPVIHNKSSATLKNLLEYKNGKYASIISTSFAFASKSSTLASAKSAMDLVTNQTGEPCQDIFITDSGASNEPVLGWLADKRIERFSHLEG